MMETLKKYRPFIIMRERLIVDIQILNLSWCGAPNFNTLYDCENDSILSSEVQYEGKRKINRQKNSQTKTGNKKNPARWLG